MEKTRYEIELARSIERTKDAIERAEEDRDFYAVERLVRELVELEDMLASYQSKQYLKQMKKAAAE